MLGANLEDKLLVKLQLPVDPRTRDTAWGHVLGEVRARQAKQQLVAGPQARLCGGGCTGALEHNPYLALGAAKADVGLGEQEGKGLGHRVVGPCDGDLAAHDARVLVRQVGPEEGNWGW